MRGALVLSLALLAIACGRDLHDPEPLMRDQSGSVRVALSASSDQGATYFLRDSTVEISGSALLTLAARDAHEDALTTPLPYGTYSLYLRPGYRVVQVQADGREQPVEAKLESANPRRFTLGPLEDSNVTLTFDIGGDKVVFGAASPLRVTSVLGAQR